MTPTQAAGLELELTRVPGDRRLYALAGIGTLRLEGLFGRRATAETAGGRFEIDRRGFWRRELEAVDALGAVAGEFVPRTIRRGGTLAWGDRRFELSPASAWRERYGLYEGERELVLLDGKGWGRRPVRLTIKSAETLDPGLLLFAAFVVRGLAEDSGSAASGAAASTAAIS